MQNDELIERLEKATADDAGLMREVFAACYPEPAPDCEPAWRPENPKQPIYHAWKTRQIRFEQLLRAEAYESAALTLVPPGYDWAAGTGRAEHMTENGRKPWAWCVPSEGFAVVEHLCLAPTPALAIVIAALKARGA